MRILERTIEASVVGHAKALGMIARKMDGLGFIGWPDRMFLYVGSVLFIEFKRPGEKPTPAQEALHTLLRAHGFAVRVCDDSLEGKRALEAFRVAATARKVALLSFEDQVEKVNREFVDRPKGRSVAQHAVDLVRKKARR